MSGKCALQTSHHFLLFSGYRGFSNQRIHEPLQEELQDSKFLGLGYGKTESHNSVPPIKTDPFQKGPRLGPVHQLVRLEKSPVKLRPKLETRFRLSSTQPHKAVTPTMMSDQFKQAIVKHWPPLRKGEGCQVRGGLHGSAGQIGAVLSTRWIKPFKGSKIPWNYSQRLTCEASHVQLPEALVYLQVTEVRWSHVEYQRYYINQGNKQIQ